MKKRHTKIINMMLVIALVFMLMAALVPQANATYYVKSLNARISTLITAGEDLATGEVVCIKDSDGYAYKADANDSDLFPAIGVVGKGASSGSYVEIITRGKLSGWSSLAEGQPGFLSDTAGAVSQTASTTYQQQVAIAVSSTEYMFDFAEKMDAELAAIAGLTSAANKYVYFTGSGAAALGTVSAYIRGILDDADEATFKASVNLEPGTDVQAYDAELAAVAGLTFADDKIILGTGAGTIATADCTVFAQS
ncbi:MAG: hypothetical protein JXA07_04145, partial [Spirochaetes bacterium]|nr:hypothetical protein [Spirochaetota bacterium]